MISSPISNLDLTISIVNTGSNLLECTLLGNIVLNMESIRDKIKEIILENNLYQIKDKTLDPSECFDSFWISGEHLIYYSYMVTISVDYRIKV